MTLTPYQLTEEETRLLEQPLTAFGEKWAEMRLEAIYKEIRCVVFSTSSARCRLEVSGDAAASPGLGGGVPETGIVAE